MSQTAEEFRHVTFDEQHLVDERALRRLMADWRRGRATKRLWDVISDGYVGILSAAIVGGMIVSALLSMQRSTAGCTEAGCVAARGLAPWLMLIVAWLVALGAARLFGPVVASAAEGFWLMEAPVRRSRLLIGRLWAILALATGIGALGGALVAIVSGNSFVETAWWALATGLLAAGLTALAAAEQSTERRWLLGGLQLLGGVAMAAALVGVTALGVGWVTWPGTVETPPVVLWGVAAAGLALLLVGALVAARRLDDLRRHRLVSGGSLVESVQGAAFGLDFGLLRDILQERKYFEIGHVRPRRGKGSGASALIWRDVVRLGRNPRPLIVLALSVIVPYALAALGLGNLGPSIAALVLFVVMVPFLDSLRVLSRTKGLARCLPLSTAQIRDAVLFVPIALAALWALATLPAFFALAAGTSDARGVGGVVSMCLVTAAAGLLGAVRWVGARPPDFNAPMFSTAAGALPPGLIGNLIKGIDIVALATLPIVLGAPMWVSIIICVIVYFMLRSGGIDMADLSAKSEEARREMAEERANAKKLAGGEKIKRARPNAPAAGVPRGITVTPRPAATAPATSKADRRKPRGRNQPN